MKTIIALAVGLTLAGCQSNELTTNKAPSVQPANAATNNVTEAQKFTVTVDNGFSPETVDAKAGQPVEITFDTKHKACATQVIFKELGITKDLADGQRTVISFTPEKPGEYAFACPMNMFKGKVTAK
jgi:plastocyanin domain-containing protein